MEQIKFAIAIVGAFFVILGVAVLAVAAIVASFQIDTADDYYAVGKLGGERLLLKGLPFSLGRMTEYGMLILFSHTRYVQKRYGQELELIVENAPPKQLERMLVWLYATWFLLVIAGFILGCLLMLLPEAR